MMQPKEILGQLEAYVTEEWHRKTVEPSSVQPAVSPVRSGQKSGRSPKAEALLKLSGECLDCRNCELYRTAQNLVFSDGSADAELVFVGEAPGADEDAQGKPFVGRAGKLLTATLAELGVNRDDVYICNILKHRPPENRNPLPQEITACTPFLTRQLEILKPKVLITLGNFSTRFILKTEEGITKLRGNFYKSPEGYNVMPILHPAAILRNMNQLDEFRNDLKKALQSLR